MGKLRSLLLDLVAEVKWRRLTIAERKSAMHQLQHQWSRRTLAAEHPNVRFEVLDATLLAGK